MMIKSVGQQEQMGKTAAGTFKNKSNTEQGSIPAQTLMGSSGLSLCCRL